jgi:cytochrome c-type biogenesis protein CcmF
VTRIIGYSAVVIALILAVYGMVATVAGARTRRRDLVRSGQSATYANFVLMLLANLAMVYALVTHDFSIHYVAQVGSRETPLFYTVISLWGALEGSILFWGLVLSAYAATAVFFTRRRSDEPMIAYANSTMLAVEAFFFLLLVVPANPFGLVSPVPADGPGPNTLLQNHILMGIHPPFLYTGYVGMTIPFAFAIGALVAGKLDTDWIRTSRPWMMVAWGFLSVAIMFGMWWSYDVLGWGGYWAWDPVENASFLPWLTATAFLHSAMVQERRGMLRTWNFTLIVATFLLTVLGTFLTRSGVLSSVHAFTEGTVGIYFLAFIGLTLIVSIALLVGRSRQLESTGRLDSALSRETVFLLNNLLLTAFTFTVLLGTLFPLVAEAIRGVKVSVGEPFFNRMTLPLAMALIFLIGVGPALPWRRTPEGYLGRRLIAPSVALVLGVVAGVVAGTRSAFALMTFGFAAFAIMSNLMEFWVAMSARHAAHGEAYPLALVRAVASNRRRYGGYVAHLGVLMLATGVAASSTFRIDREVTLNSGDSTEVGGYSVGFDRVWAKDEPQRFVVGATMRIGRGGKALGTLDPRMNFYRTQEQPVSSPAVRSRPDRDLYLTLMSFARDGSSVTLRVLVEPLVAWIWVGGLTVGLGAVIAGWRRDRSRLGRAAPGAGAPALASVGGDE